MYTDITDIKTDKTWPKLTKQSDTMQTQDISTHLKNTTAKDVFPSIRGLLVVLVETWLSLYMLFIWCRECYRHSSVYGIYRGKMSTVVFQVLSCGTRFSMIQFRIFEWVFTKKSRFNMFQLLKREIAPDIFEHHIKHDPTWRWYNIYIIPDNRF